jgi:hypothetical protein
MNEKLISQKLFQRSYYAIGAGKNLMALLKFSHLTQDFIFCNLYLDKEEILSYYLHEIKYFAQDLDLISHKVIDDFDELEHFELPKNYHAYLGRPSYFSDEDAKMYQKTFQPAMGEKQCAMVFKVFRKSTQKELNLYYLFVEGLATLHLMSKGGKKMPLVIENIQCGNAIDDPENGLLAKFLNSPGVQKPLIWLRGFQPSYDVWSNGRKNTLEDKGPMPVVGMDILESWLAEPYDGNWRKPKKRYVKGFISAQKNKEILDSLATIKQTENHHVYWGDVRDLSAQMKPNDKIVMNRKLAKKLKMEDDRILFWDDFSISHFKTFLVFTAEQMVVRLANYLLNLDVSLGATIYVLPETTEDQGGLFLSALEKLPYKTVACFYRPFEAYYSFQEKLKISA